MMDTSLWRRHGATSVFVLLWSSGAIFARLGLEHASAFGFLTLRFAVALAVLSILALVRRQPLLPAPGTRLRVAGVGALLVGTYSICYLLALDRGVAPGVLATVLGTQPILTLAATERRFAPARWLGLALALGGLVLIVYDGIALAELSAPGIGFALAALAGMTAGAIAQKSIAQPPSQVLPLQYAVGLAMCLALDPWQPLHAELTAGFLVPLLWLGVLISVVAQLVLYRLIRAGDLVNVTSVFYLVPITTAAMDRLILGHPLSALQLAGMATIVCGLALVFRRTG